MSIESLMASVWFDADWYCEQYPDVVRSGLSPAEHYLRFGESWGRRPGPTFDPAWYLARYTDIAEAGISPLLHFIIHGEQEDRLPCELEVPGWDAALWAGEASVESCLQALWAQLENGPLAEASLAGFALARWYAWRQEWGRVLECLAQRPDQPGSLPRHAGPALLRVEAAGQCGRLAEAWRALVTLHRVSPSLADTSLAVANVLAWQAAAYDEAPEAQRMEWERQRLGWINDAWLPHSLTPVERLEHDEPLSLDNLGIGATPELVEGTHSRALRATSRSSIYTPQRLPLISVIVPAYEAADTLPTALRSLAEQRDVELEVIVVDDASPDATSSVAEAFAQHDARFRVLRQSKNQGAYAARNRGLAEARGEFITVHDSDDWSHPDKLSVQAAGLVAHHDWMACCSHWVRCSASLLFSCWRMEQGWTYRNVSSLMFRRRVFEVLGFWDEVRAEADTEYYYRIRAAFGIEAVGEVLPWVPLAFGRQVANSLTSVGRTHLATQFQGARADYRAASQAWHSQAREPEDLFVPREPVRRPFEAPPVLLP